MATASPDLGGHVVQLTMAVVIPSRRAGSNFWPCEGQSVCAGPPMLHLRLKAPGAGSLRPCLADTCDASCSSTQHGDRAMSVKADTVRAMNEAYAGLTLKPARGGELPIALSQLRSA